MDGIWAELGMSGGTALIVLAALYFVVKWAVKNGMKEAWKERIRKDLGRFGEENAYKMEEPGHIDQHNGHNL